jgi:hypothetical protein
MKILFLSLTPIYTLLQKGIYADMIQEFNSLGDNVDYFFPSQSKFFKQEGNCSFQSFKLKRNPQKQANFIKKYLSYLQIDSSMSNIIKQSVKSYDALILVTPSIFQLKIIKSFKKINKGSKVILLLKDIFPDNAIDLGILKYIFPMSLAIKYFKYIERKLYQFSDYIGCMTALNIEYISKKHKHISYKLFLSQNSIKPYSIKKKLTRQILNLPEDKTILIFIGNIGLPQDSKFINIFISSLLSNMFLLLIGTGSSFTFTEHKQVRIINKLLNQDEIDQYLVNSDYGLVFLSHKFNVPNFPSKLLAYFNAEIPILAFTNSYNDLNPIFNNSFPTKIYWNMSDSLSIERIFLNYSTRLNSSINAYSVYNQVNDIRKLLL